MHSDEAPNNDVVDEKPLTKEENSLLTKVLRAKLVQSTKEVEVQRKDPKSPLYSVKSFEELPLKEALRRGVYGMGFNSPSKIQETALPMLLADPPNNMIAQSQSGTGKTAAFVLTMLSRVNPEESFPQVICLSPTMELAKQTGAVAEQMAKYCPEVKIAYAIRGNRLSRGEKLTSQIIIGTPGTLMDWILKVRAFDPKKIRVFVLDEADVMIDTQGHKDQSVRIHKFLPKDCQMLLFSATYEEQVMKFAESIIPEPIVIRLRREEESLENIRQFYVVCTGMEQKFESLSNMYGVISIGQCIVFCHTRKAAAWLSEKMSREGHSVALLSGEITVEQRIAVLNRFRAGKEKLLITTNVCARGIDIEQVSVVINFDLPMDRFNAPDFETYLHRIGRTGRFGRYGLAVNFVNEGRDLPLLKKIEEHFGRPIEELNTNDVDALEKLNE
ncbi:ATP-dependent RNA helicase DDX19A [Paramuricea clavata]|uniref:RNA helicase n=1 Tax=Paramuricea clavata TaxID=317549 RepID=A0A6S7IIH7_PARCT|nr:ATP-dependent RNA helicase DDX19A [Paramuricea clavata]